VVALYAQVDKGRQCLCNVKFVVSTVLYRLLERLLASMLQPGVLELDLPVPARVSYVHSSPAYLSPSSSHASSSPHDGCCIQADVTHVRISYDEPCFDHFPTGYGPVLCTFDAKRAAGSTMRPRAQVGHHGSNNIWQAVVRLALVTISYYRTWQ
jgi:hypothetical protein